MTLKIWLPFLIVLVIGKVTSLNDYKTIKTDLGTIRGRLESTIFENKPFYAFRGIPYARPPINNLRFKAPQPLGPWTGTKDVFEFGNVCIQRTFIFKNIVGAEDCLFLNVYVPANLNEPAAVMVFIHGGAFYLGSGDGYGPDLLVNQDVILVTFNYRLGPYGFLSLGTPEYSGNMGLKDQLAAIRWVKQNIDKFGGDASKITIFGDSAGSASVQYQMLSSKSKDLFHRAIMQSGSALNPWAFYEKQDHVEYLYGLAKRFGHGLNSIDELKNFLNNVDPELVIQASYTDFTEENVIKESKQRWIPLVEISDANDPFLLKHPREILTQKSNQDVDLMIGFTSDEMYILTLPFLFSPSLFEKYNENFVIQLPRRDWTYNENSKEYKDMMEDIRQFYIGGPLNQESYFKFNDLVSDTTFGFGIYESANYHFQTSSGNIFFYKFSLNTDLNMFKTNYGQAKLGLPGASHADDLFYLFKFDFEHISFDEIYQNISRDSIEMNGIEIATKLWSNFAKYGTPTPPNLDQIQAEAITKNQFNFIDITNEGIVKGINPMAERMKFWQNFYKKYNNVFKKSYAIKDEL